MYMDISYKFHRIPDTQPRVITKVHDLLGQPSYLDYQYTNIVRPANRDWACQTERCHTLSKKTSHSKSGVIAYVRFTRATN